MQAWPRKWQVLQARQSPDTEAQACLHANMVVCFQACHLNCHAPEIRSCLLFFIYAPNGLVIVYPLVKIAWSLVGNVAGPVRPRV